MRFRVVTGAIFSGALLIVLHVVEPECVLMLAPPERSPERVRVCLQRETATRNLSDFKAWAAEEGVSNGLCVKGVTYPAPIVVRNDDHSYALFHPNLLNDSWKQEPGFLLLYSEQGGGLLLSYHASWELGLESEVVGSGMAYRDRVSSILRGTTAIRWAVTGILIFVMALAVHRDLRRHLRSENHEVTNCV